MVFFFSLFGLIAFLFFPAFRSGGTALVGVILTQITGIIIGISVRSVASHDADKRDQK